MMKSSQYKHFENAYFERPHLRMNTRRNALQQSLAVAGLLATAGLWPGRALAFTKAAFDAKNMAEAVRALGGQPPMASKDISLEVPEIADNGAAVRVSFSTTLPRVQRMLLLAEKNPSPLVAVFNVNENIEPSFIINTKLSESTDVLAVAMLADGRVLFTKKPVKVTLGACGN
jgi:sulfur-oxidizing protein SoxY